MVIGCSSAGGRKKVVYILFRYFAVILFNYILSIYLVCNAQILAPHTQIVQQVIISH